MANRREVSENSQPHLGVVWEGIVNEDSLEEAVCEMRCAE